MALNPKTCPKCKLDLPRSSFTQRRNGEYVSRCKDCVNEDVREWRAKNREKLNERRRKEYDPHSRPMSERAAKLGVTPDQYFTMVFKAGNRCEICGKKPITKNLSVDHDHSTGKIRGLLCNACNTALGGFKDDPAILEKAAAYLRSHAPSAQ